MGSCVWFGALSGEWGYRERRIGERDGIAVLSGRELDGGRRATMWVSPTSYMLHAQSMLFLISYLMRSTGHETSG